MAAGVRPAPSAHRGSRATARPSRRRRVSAAISNRGGLQRWRELDLVAQLAQVAMAFVDVVARFLGAHPLQGVARRRRWTRRWCPGAATEYDDAGSRRAGVMDLTLLVTPVGSGTVHEHAPAAVSSVRHPLAARDSSSAPSLPCRVRPPRSDSKIAKPCPTSPSPPAETVGALSTVRFAPDKPCAPA